MGVRIAALAAAVAVAVVAGCGGGGGGDRLTKAEYIAAADAICKATNDELGALPDPSSIEEVASLAEQAVSIEEDALAKLKELKPPEADQATIDEALGLLEQQVELGRQLGDAAKAGDGAKVQEIVGQIDPINQQANEIATQYGLVECGND